MTNLKAGDLAFVVKVKNHTELLGRIAEIKKFVGYYEFRGGFCDANVWDVAMSGSCPAGGNFPRWPLIYVPGSFLSPIRDQDGEDEILRIAGKPQEEKANA